MTLIIISIQGGWGTENIPDYDVEINKGSGWGRAFGIPCGPNVRFSQIKKAIENRYPKTMWKYMIMDKRRKGGDYVITLTSINPEPYIYELFP